MSVVGFDVGNDTSTVALARRKGIDVVLNKESKRETPAMVSFSSKQRFLGTDGAAAQTMNPKNTVTQIKRLIGRKFKSEGVQSDIQKFPFEVIEGPDGEPQIGVMYMDQKQYFSPERALAMQLTDLKTIAETDGGAEVKDCVIACPVFFTERQRRAMLDASSIAGLNCLRLMNETTATALAYGIYKTDLPEDKPVNVAFVDCGHSALQVCIAAFKKGELRVLAHSWDENVGGRDFDEALFDHYADACKEKYKIDVRSNSRASLRLRTACDKLKKILSANSDAPLNIECLMDDKDIQFKATRDEFEALAAGVLARVEKPLAQALADSGLTKDDISSVELVGSASRVPSVLKVITAVFGKEGGRTLNASECVSRGCALQCAMLSPTFRVRDFDVHDVCPFPISFQWQGDGSDTVVNEVFKAGNPIPSTKMLTFFRSEPFSLQAKYSQAVPLGSALEIGEYKVGPFTVPEGKDKAKLKVKVKLNLHGCLSVESAQMVVEEEAKADEEGDAKMDEAAAAANGDAAANGEAKEDAAPMETEAGEDKKEGEAKKTKKVHKSDVPVEGKPLCLSAADLQTATEKEFDMRLQDRIQEETKAKKNEVEEYVYDKRAKIYESLEPYITDADKESFSALLSATEDWLYEDGEDESKGVYIAKLEELKKVGDPIEARYKDDQTRGEAASALAALCAQYTEMATGGNALYEHIEAGEKERVVNECGDAAKWLSDKQAAQEQQPKSADPVLKTADILKKKDTVDRVCRPIMSKPKPAPPPPPKEEVKAEEKPAEGEPMQTEGGEGAAEGGEPAPMQADLD